MYLLAPAGPARARVHAGRGCGPSGREPLVLWHRQTRRSTVAPHDLPLAGRPDERGDVARRRHLDQVSQAEIVVYCINKT